MKTHCDICGEPLKPSWQTWFCPNECDLKPHSGISHFVPGQFVILIGIHGYKDELVRVLAMDMPIVANPNVDDFLYDIVIYSQAREFLHAVGIRPNRLRKASDQELSKLRGKESQYKDGVDINNPPTLMPVRGGVYALQADPKIMLYSHVANGDFKEFENVRIGDRFKLDSVEKSTIGKEFLCRFIYLQSGAHIRIWFENLSKKFTFDEAFTQV